MSSALLDRTGRELAAGDLVRAVEGPRRTARPGRVNFTTDTTVWVEGVPYGAHDITNRVEELELVGQGADRG